MLSDGASLAMYIGAILWAVCVAQLAQSLGYSTAPSIVTDRRPDRSVFITGLVIALIPLTFISAVRKDIGVDYGNYVYLYDKISGIKGFSGFLELFLQVEPGFALLNLIIYVLADNVYVVFASCSVLFLFLMGKGLVNFYGTISAGLATFILTTQLFAQSLNIIRQLIAVMLIWCAIKPMMERRFGAFLCYLILAFSFHYTAILVLPFYFACGDKKWNKIVCWGLVTGFTLFLLSFGLLAGSADIFGKFSIYMSIEKGSTGIQAGIVILRLPFFIPFLFYRRIVGLDRKYRIFFAFIWVEFIFSLLGSYNSILNRLSLYFETGWAILLPLSVRVAPSRKWKMVTAVAVIAGVAFNFWWAMVKFRGGGAIPYSTFLDWKWGVNF